MELFEGGMEFEPYKFQNIYIITTYRCNWKCDFCLFRCNKEKETTIKEILYKLEYAINDSKKNVYIKITGGEPFLKTKLLKGIFELSRKYQNKIYKIGIGSNGSKNLPDYFNDVNIKTHIFLSRHNINDNLPTPQELSKNINNPFVDFRANCNLIKGNIDDTGKIKQYIHNKYNTTGIDHFCFRELSKIDINKNLMYSHEVYKYIKYYKKHLVDLAEILRLDDSFKYSRNTGNYYDINHWYWYRYGNKKISVKFRSIDEVKLIDFNSKVNPNSIDEYVIHPDGTLTGCWDKNMKIIMKGGNYYAKSSLYTETNKESKR